MNLSKSRLFSSDVSDGVDEAEMYPEKELRTFNLDHVDSIMEGKYRKDHFKGVAHIVSKLFEVVRPNRAYFGQKDFQQLVIVRKLVKLLKLDLIIVECPIIREEDGLAMSSRNVLLNKREREHAPFIYLTLSVAREKQGSMTPAEVISWVEVQFEQHPALTLEYFEIVEDKELNQVYNWNEPVNKVGCIAVQLGGARLIDNVKFD